MADDPTKRGSVDRSRINTHEDYEVRYWSKEFGVSKERLIEAVKKCGPLVDDVKRELEREGVLHESGT